MELYFTDIQDFEKLYNDPNTVWNLNRTKCSCGDFCEMKLKNVEVHISDRNIHLHDCPVMTCDECGHEHLCPDTSPHKQDSRKKYDIPFLLP